MYCGVSTLIVRTQISHNGCASCAKVINGDVASPVHEGGEKS